MINGNYVLEDFVYYNEDSFDYYETGSPYMLYIKAHRGDLQIYYDETSIRLEGDMNNMRGFVHREVPASGKCTGTISNLL